MDGTRDDHPIFQAECTDESVEAGMHFRLLTTTYTNLFEVQLHDIASGLDYHDQPFIHPDIKSE